MELCLILEDDLAELIDEHGDVQWSSEDSENGLEDYDQTTSDETVIAHLLRSGVIESEDEIGEVVIDRAGSLDAEGDFDDDDDEDELTEIEDND